MTICRLSFSLSDGTTDLDIDILQDLPDCVIRVGCEIAFDKFIPTLCAEIASVRWWDSSEHPELEMQQIAWVCDLEEFAESIQDDERIVFMELSRDEKSHRIWPEQQETQE